MASQRKFVGVLTSSPALGSIITTMVGDVECLHVQQFNDMAALVAHMRIVPLDLIVCDYELENGTALDLVGRLRELSTHRHYQLIVLTSRISREIKLGCRFAKADEVIVKPMSPLFLKERVLCRLGLDDIVWGGDNVWRPASSDMSPSKLSRRGENGSDWPDNVVPLFSPGADPVVGPGDGARPS